MVDNNSYDRLAILSGATSNVRQGTMYVNPAYGGMGSGESRTEDDPPWPAPIASGHEDSAAGSTSTGLLVARKGGRREWLRDAGVILALVLAITALGLTLDKGCDCKVCCASGGPYATTAEITALNLTLAPAAADVTRRIDSQEANAVRLCDALYKSKAIALSMEVVQEVDTSGATDWESFTLNGTAYLAVANRYDGETHNIKSRIYRHSAISGQFELAQEVDTTGANDWEAFTVDGTAYLAVAHFNDDLTHNIKSHIYRHSAVTDHFELAQEVDTSGAADWEAFTVDGAIYLAVANHFDGSTYKLKSRIYRHSAVTGRFELAQEVDTSGAVDWESFMVDGATYLSVANHLDGSTYNLKSRIYHYSAESDQFELVQEVDTTGAHDWEAFTVGGTACLAVANYRSGSTFNLKSRIYRHSAVSGQFELAQEVDMGGAFDWEDFTLNGATYLAVANHIADGSLNIKSRIYRYSLVSNQFELALEVDTSGALDWEAFTVDGTTYLAVANYQDGITYNIKSRIYRVGAPC